jgi:hypothetical protein
MNLIALLTPLTAVAGLGVGYLAGVFRTLRRYPVILAQMTDDERDSLVTRAADLKFGNADAE